MANRIGVALDNNIYQMYVTPEELFDNYYLNSYFGDIPISDIKRIYNFYKQYDNKIDHKWYVIYSMNSDGSVNGATPLACMTKEMKYVTDRFLESKGFHYDLFIECQIIPKLKYYHYCVNNQNYSIM